MSVPLPMETDCASVKGMLDRGEPFLLLDCREASEHALVNIPQAQLLPMSELTARVSELAAYQDALVIIHCHHGGRSLRVANWLRQQGFAKAQSMKGGIDDWAVSIQPGLPRY